MHQTTVHNKGFIPFFVFLFILSLSTNSLNATEKDTSGQKMKAVEVRTLSPYMGEDFYRIYYAGDLVMCQSHYYHGTSHNETTVVDTSANGDLTITSNADSFSYERRPYYFVYHKDSLYGYNFAPLDAKNDNKRYLADSLLKSRKLQSDSKQDISKSKPDSAIWNREKTELKEVYICKPTETIPTTVTVTFHYSKNLNHIKESFSPALDNVHQMKFYKIEYLFASFWSESHKMQVPEMKTFHEIAEVTVENGAEIHAYFDRYKKMIASPKK